MRELMTLGSALDLLLAGEVGRGAGLLVLTLQLVRGKAHGAQGKLR